MCSLHFAISLQDPTFADGEDWRKQVPMDLTRGMNLYPLLSINISLHNAANDDRLNFDLPFNDCRFTDNQCSALEDLSLELAIETKHALKGHLSFKDRLLP